MVINKSEKEKEKYKSTAIRPVLCLWTGKYLC
ncbi:uncharacterized protein METZ01_LOCUS92226 [marine metagenome]|uniref:Uncharacterized protein n=1 Tax=marine metagenome TaxID=408172 RepID=A0A381VGI2_9ZZZZ